MKVDDIAEATEFPIREVRKAFVRDTYKEYCKSKMIPEKKLSTEIGIVAMQ